MSNLQAIQRQIESARDLHSVAKTMQGLAAARLWHYRRAVTALADYSRTVELGLQIVLRDLPLAETALHPARGADLAALLIGSNQGLCGRFNERLAAYASDRLAGFAPPPGQRHLVVAGLRLANQLAAEGQPLQARLMMPGSIEAVASLVQQLVLRLDDWRTAAHVEQVVIFHNRPLSGASYEPHMTRLWPLDADWLRGLQARPWESRTLPTFRLDRVQVFRGLIRHYYFGRLYRALAESLAAENASRLASMQAAEKNIDERLADLNNAYQRQRQQTITAELLDIVAGAEALEQGS